MHEHKPHKLLNGILPNNKVVFDDESIIEVTKHFRFFFFFSLNFS